MDLPVGLARVSGERIAAVDQSGRVFFLGSPTDLVNTTAEVSSFTVNSFGTILAYISPGASTVRGYILAAGKDQLFIDCGIPLTDIRFSEDNRYLGIGTSEGKILVFDMASRQIAQTLTTPSLRGVRYLRPTPEGGWVAAYDNDKVALWESFGSLLNTTGTNGGVTCLAVDGKTGTVAYGDSLGEITILDKDFELLVTASLHEEDIVSVVFEPSGSSLVTAGRDGAVRRIEF
jgi:WD40 repeat protein